MTFKPLTFIRQIRSELGKIVWPTRKETLLSGMAVFLMVMLCSIFLFFTDQILSFFIRLILNLGA